MKVRGTITEHTIALHCSRIPKKIHFTFESTTGSIPFQKSVAGKCLQLRTAVIRCVVCSHHGANHPLSSQLAICQKLRMLVCTRSVELYVSWMWHKCQGGDISPTLMIPKRSQPQCIEVKWKWNYLTRFESFISEAYTIKYQKCVWFLFVCCYMSCYRFVSTRIDMVVAIRCLFNWMGFVQLSERVFFCFKIAREGKIRDILLIDLKSEPHSPYSCV